MHGIEDPAGGGVHGGGPLGAGESKTFVNEDGEPIEPIEVASGADLLFPTAAPPATPAPSRSAFASATRSSGVLLSVIFIVPHKMDAAFESMPGAARR